MIYWPYKTSEGKIHDVIMDKIYLTNKIVLGFYWYYFTRHTIITKLKSIWSDMQKTTAT